VKSTIHPDYREVVVTCACGAVHQIRSTRLDKFSVEICSSCHPFYTGRERTSDSKGRVERFRKKYKVDKPS